MPKIPRGSFDQALWRQAFVVRALKLAVCLHGPLLLGRSSLPSAGSFDQALWRQAFVVRALKPAVCLQGVQACRLPAFKPLKSPAAALVAIEP